MKRKDSSLHSSQVTKCSTYAESTESDSFEGRIQEDNESEASNTVFPKINLTQSKEAFVESLTQSISSTSIQKQEAQAESLQEILPVKNELHSNILRALFNSQKLRRTYN